MYDTSGLKRTSSRYLTLILLLLAGASIQAAPAADFGLTATTVSSSRIDLSWNGVPGASDYYITRRVGLSGVFSQLLVVDKNTTSFSDFGLASATTYYYQIIALKNNGGILDLSEIVGATTFGTTDTTPPTVGITSPANGSTYTSAQTVTLTASASDNVGVARVDFYKGGVFQGSDTSAPYNYSWVIDQSLNGTHSWIARASDAAGNAANSPTINLSVSIGSGQDTTSPSTPTGVQAVATSCTAVAVSWNASSDPESQIVYYIVMRNGFPLDSTTATSYQDTNLGGSTSASYTIVAVNGVGLTSESAPASVTTPPCTGPDTTPPTTPTNLAATAIACNQVNLSWFPSFDSGSGVAGYRIYKNSIFIATSPTASFVDTSVQASSFYSYRVAAYDGAGNLSNTSVALGVTTPQCGGGDTTPPTVPTGLNASAVGCSQINLFWNASSDSGSGVAGYRLYRNGVFIGNSTNTSFGDTNLAAGTTYTYNVASYDSAGNVSSTSLPAAATTGTCADTTPPSRPDGLNATAVSCSQINLSWNPSTDTGGSGLAGYRVYRNNVYIAAVASTFYSNIGLAASTSYQYRVAAYDGAGNTSSISSLSSASTPSCGNSSPVANAGPDQTINVGDSVTLNGTGSYDPDGSIVSYSWNFGDGTSGSGAVVSHTYSSQGTYWVTLTVTDNNGASNTDTAYVEVQSQSGSDGAHYFSQRFGGTGADIGFASAVDPATGDIVMTGYFSGSANFGGQNLVSQGSTDIFLARYTSEGTLQWARRFGGTGSDRGLGVVVSGGEITIVGYFSVTADFGGTSRVSRGLTDIFLARYSSQGSLRWVQGFGSPGADSGNALAVGSDGSVAIAGGFYGTVDFGGGALTSDGDSDIFVARYVGSSGAPIWSARFGNAGIDAANGVAMDGVDVLLTGSFIGSISFGGSTLVADSIDPAIFVAKLVTSNGSTYGHGWSRAIGGTRSDYGNDVAVDSGGDAVITGRIRSSTADFGGSSPPALGSEDIFVAKYRGTNGSLLWVRRTGDNSSDDSRNVAIDGSDNIILTGKIDNAVSFLGELYVAKYSPNGSVLWSQRMAGSGTVGGVGVAVGSDGKIVVTGHFDGTLNLGGGNLVSYGSVDVFLLKLWP